MQIDEIISEIVDDFIIFNKYDKVVKLHNGFEKRFILQYFSTIGFTFPRRFGKSVLSLKLLDKYENSILLRPKSTSRDKWDLTHNLITIDGDFVYKMKNEDKIISSFRKFSSNLNKNLDLLIIDDYELCSNRLTNKIYTELEKTNCKCIITFSNNYKI